MIHSIFRALVLLCASFLVGCAANQMHGFQNTYYSYNVPQPLLEQITLKFKQHGLVNARIVRDNVGRVQLKGSYKNEDEVDRAFIIVQSTVGLKSTSPFYPENINEKRWEVGAAKALSDFTTQANAKPQKRALIIGINDFKNLGLTKSIQGEDDAKVVKRAAEKAGYLVTALLGENATKSNIEAALAKMKREISPNDSLFIYISSHGTPPVPLHTGHLDRKMSIVAWDSSPFKNGNRADKTDSNLNLQLTSVSDTDVQELGNMPTRNTRILIDTCYSGDILKGIPNIITTASDRESNEYINRTNGGQPERASITTAPWIPAYASKGIQFTPEAQAALPTKSIEKARQTSSALDFSGRFTLITATSDGQESLGPPILQGVRDFDNPVSPGKKLTGTFFTQAFFEYLNMYEGQLEPAFRDAKRFTEQHVNKVSNGDRKQIPRLEPFLRPTDLSNLYK